MWASKVTNNDQTGGTYAESFTVPRLTRFADGSEKLDASKLTRALQCAIGSKFTEAFLEGYLAAHFMRLVRAFSHGMTFKYSSTPFCTVEERKSMPTQLTRFYPVVSPFEDLRRDQVAVEQYDYTNAPVVSEHPLENTDAQRLRSKWVDQAKKDNVAGKNFLMYFAETTLPKLASGQTLSTVR